MGAIIPRFTDQDVNIIINTDAHDNNVDLIPLLFGKGAKITHMWSGTDMAELLVKFGFFTSRTEARKNWKHSGFEIPNGWTEILGVGKMKRNIFIFKPVHTDGEIPVEY